MQEPRNPLITLRQDIDAICHRTARDPAAVTLMAVSKTRTAVELAALADQGQRHFGENYLQEALEKMDALAERALVWHFIGPIQSNKTRDMAARFDWVHSVDRLKVARRRSEQRPADLPPLNVCIQVNVDDEDSKSGVPLGEVATLAETVATLPNLTLRGLMAIPRADSDDGNRAAFRQLAMTLSQLRNTMPALDTLSMGMSADYEVAIEEGATVVRLGTALFGPRPSR